MAPLSCYAEALTACLFGVICTWLFLSALYQRRENRALRRHTAELEQLGAKMQTLKMDYTAHGLREFVRGLNEGRAQAAREILS